MNEANRQTTTPTTRHPPMAAAVPTLILSTSTTSATTSPTRPVSTSTMGTLEATRKARDVDERDWVNGMARRIASSSNVMLMKSRARVVVVVVVEPEMSILDWMVRTTPAWVTERLVF
jgi:hypothetical protein